MELQKELSTADLAIDFSHDDAPDSLSPDVILCSYRVAQEALSNAVKHSRADRVSIRLRRSPRGITLTINDNGAGFDVRAAQHGIGLLSMRERVEQIGGSLFLRSDPGNGTQLEVHLPCAPGGTVGGGIL